jgi:hypothetical protein
MKYAARLPSSAAVIKKTPSSRVKPGWVAGNRDAGAD